VIIHSACIIEATVVGEAVFSDVYRRVTVFVRDPVKFLAESPWYNLKNKVIS
jgi:hypothetical protein